MSLHVSQTGQIVSPALQSPEVVAPLPRVQQQTRSLQVSHSNHPIPHGRIHGASACPRRNTEGATRCKGGRSQIKSGVFQALRLVHLHAHVHFVLHFHLRPRQRLGEEEKYDFASDTKICTASTAENGAILEKVIEHDEGARAAITDWSSRRVPNWDLSKHERTGALQTHRTNGHAFETTAYHKSPRSLTPPS